MDRGWFKEFGYFVGRLGVLFGNVGCLVQRYQGHISRFSLNEMDERVHFLLSRILFHMYYRRKTQNKPLHSLLPIADNKLT
jgi:hypothetical protein